MKKIFYVMILFIGLMGCLKILALVDENNYNIAINKCGSKDNIIINYDSTGDRYYSCKIEK